MGVNLLLCEMMLYAGLKILFFGNKIIGKKNSKRIMLNSNCVEM